MARAREVQTIVRTARLSEDFGLRYAIRLFGEEAVNSLPLITRGPNKGKTKGHINWRVTTAAGYHSNAGCAVKTNTTVRAWISAGPGAAENAAVDALWMGRIQSLCGSRGVLTQEYRDRSAEEQARDKAERDAAFEEELAAMASDDQREAARARRNEWRERFAREREEANAKALADLAKRM